MTQQKNNTITIEFYGQLKDVFQAHSIEHRLDRNPVDHVEQLYLNLCEQHPNAPVLSNIRPIINDTFVDWDAGFSAGDVIGFFPPASGG